MKKLSVRKRIIFYLVLGILLFGFTFFFTLIREQSRLQPILEQQRKELKELQSAHEEELKKIQEKLTKGELSQAEAQKLRIEHYEKLNEKNLFLLEQTMKEIVQEDEIP